MKKHGHILWIGWLICLCVAGPLTAADQSPKAPPLGMGSGRMPPFDQFTSAWRDDPIWYDGQAEIAYYDAVREIYGRERQYVARLITNKEHASAETFTKDPSGKGRSVFKQHLREDIETENYTYHYSTMCYVGTDDLKSLKIDMGSQEDCGATFKQFVNHRGTLLWQQFSYFPEQGYRRGQYSPPSDLVFENALSLVLRGYPFESVEQIKLMMLADQTQNKLSSARPRPVVVRYLGKQTLELPIDTVAAHHLRVTSNDRAARDYWFATDGSAPRLHVMVQYHGPDGVRYQLRQHERRAYWKH